MGKHSLSSPEPPIPLSEGPQPLSLKVPASYQKQIRVPVKSCSRLFRAFHVNKAMTTRTSFALLQR